jgi:hypothetical protein
MKILIGRLHTFYRPRGALERVDIKLCFVLTSTLEGGEGSASRPGQDPVPIVQKSGWTPVPVWTRAENLAPPPGFDPRTVKPVASHYTD